MSLLSIVRVTGGFISGSEIRDYVAVLLNIALSAVAQSPLPEGVTIPPIAPDPGQPAFPRPPITPSAPPKPNLQTPSTSLIPGCPAAPTSSDRIFVRDIEILGHSVLHAEIDQYILPLKRRTVAFEDLICLRAKITELYIQHGYVTSGAFLPNNQDLSDGVIQIQVVEGELDDIKISGLKHLQDGYVHSRLRQATTAPLNQQRLEQALQLLQLDPLISQVNAELTVGDAPPGQSILLIDLEEAAAFHAGVGNNNNRSPSIGSNQLNFTVAHDNLLGFGGPSQHSVRTHRRTRCFRY